MQVILASGSPRRTFLLSEMGVNHRAIASNYDEQFDQTKSAEEVAKVLALGKARAIAEKYPDTIVIGADTIVVLDGKQLGKPENAAEARRMLHAYRNRSHQIVTGLAVVCDVSGYEKVSSDSSEICFDELPDKTIEEYIATNNPFDKAGAYALQHPLIRPHITRVVGRIDSIVGLPTDILSKNLNDLGIEAVALDLNNQALLSKLDLYK